MRRYILMTVALLVACVALFAAGSAEPAATAADRVMPTPPGTLPIVNERVTFTAFTMARPWSDDYSYSGNEFTRLVAEATNVHFEWTVAPAAEATTRLNLLMASRDYPEILMGVPISMSQLGLYAAEGIVPPIDELIDGYTIHAKRMFEEYPYLRDQALIDGRIHNFSEINECYHCAVARKMWINVQWLENLGLDMPQTTAEFHQVLLAFKTQDPNGNGMADEVPLAGAISGYNPQLDHFLVNSFIQYNPDRVNVVNGRLVPVVIQPGFREAIRYIRRLYADGLIAPESFTQDDTLFRALAENPSANLLGAAPNGGLHRITTIGGPSGRWQEFATLPPLAGPDGVRRTSYNLPITWNVKAVLTDRNRNPEVAARFMDLMYEDQWILEQIWGREGTAWRWAEPGEIGINGKPALYAALISWGQQRPNTTWNQVAPTYRTSDHRLGQTKPETADLEVILFEGSQPYYEYIPDESAVLPPLLIDASVAAEYTELGTVINEYVNEMFARFVTGDANIETQWDQYVRELENIGIGRWIQIAQDAYDQKYK